MMNKKNRNERKQPAHASQAKQPVHANQANQSKHANNSRKGVKVIPLGGLDAIGRNMTLFEYEDTIIAVDCGIMFPTTEMPGIDFIIPDFTYLRQNITKFKGLLLTHGHEDHIGAVSFLLQEFSIPIIGTKLTLGLIKKRLEERPVKNTPKFIEIEAGETAKVGIFDVEFIRVNHSIVDGVALAIKTPVGKIIHTGDFKFDFSPVDGKVSDLYRFARNGEEGVLLLLSDSTNAESPGYTGSESDLNEKIMDIFSGSNGRIIVATFASNINRIQQILNAAAKYNRKVVISGRSMINNIEIAKELGYLTYREGLIVELNEAKILPDKKLTIVCTGTQGEPMSALTRIANGTHMHFACKAGDRVIVTASVIPGNERTVGTVVNQLLKMGAHVHYENIENLHVSGHASQEELKLMISLTRPKFFMPIHGQYKHLRAHVKLAESLGMKPSNTFIADNGDIMELTVNKFEKIGKINLGNVFVDGSLIDDLSSELIKDRQVMSEDGIVFVTIILQSGMLISEPAIVMKGFVGSASGQIRQMMEDDINNKLGKILVNNPSHQEIATVLKKSLRALFERVLKRDPVVTVQVIEV